MTNDKQKRAPVIALPITQDEKAPSGFIDLRDANDDVIATIYRPEFGSVIGDVANSIVTAVNNHAPLLEALMAQERWGQYENDRSKWVDYHLLKNGIDRGRAVEIVQTKCINLLRKAEKMTRKAIADAEATE